MEKENFNLMSAILFIMNSLAAVVSIIFYTLGAIPDRDTQFGKWLLGIIIMTIYGIAMLIITGYAVFYEWKKIQVKGAEFFVYNFKKKSDNETPEGILSNLDKWTPSWNINYHYTIINKGDWSARFVYEVCMILDVKDDNGDIIKAYAIQSIIDKPLKTGEELQDELLTFHFRPKEKAEKWNEATIVFKVNFQDHNFKPQSLEFSQPIKRNP